MTPRHDIKTVRAQALELHKRLIDQARAAGDTPEGRALWREVAAAARDTRAYVPLAETRVQLVAGQRLRNGLVMQPYGGYDLATAGVE